MNKLVLLVTLCMFSFSALALEDYEVVENVIKVANCKKVATAKFAKGNRFNQWIEVKGVRQISAMDFEFLVESKDNNSYQWVSANLFKSVECSPKQGIK